jgi:hypothetical protein
MWHPMGSGPAAYPLKKNQPVLCAPMETIARGTPVARPTDPPHCPLT